MVSKDDFRRALGEPDEAFVSRVNETLSSLRLQKEGKHMKKATRIVALAAALLLLSAAALVVRGVLLFKSVSRHPLLTTALAFLIGGGAGNMIDRLFVTDAMGNKVVTDFFEFTFVDFAVFNVADIFITFGAVLLGVYIVFFEGKVEKRLKEQAEESQNDDGDGE